MKGQAFNELPISIVCIKEFSKGFFVAGENGIMSVWLTAEENLKASGKNPYDFVKRWYGDDEKRSKIVSMSVSLSEEILAVAYASNDLGILKINSLSLFQEETTMNKPVSFEYICKGFHSGSINSMDIAFQRPLVATLSRDDGTIRIWNYITFQCELGRRFYVKEEPEAGNSTKPLLTLALHPNGYFMCVGFIDKSRLFHIMHNTLREYRELPVKQCTLMRFSHGGNLLCMSTIQKNIYVYQPFTLESICILKAPNSTINQISFSDDDLYFSCASHNGAISIWETTKFTEVQWGQIHSNSKYYSNCLFDSYESKYLVAGAEGGRGVFRLCSKDQNDKAITEKEFFTEDMRITNIQMLKYHFGFVISNDRGHIMFYEYPLESSQFTTYNVHNNGVNHIRVSPDGKYLFSCGNDGLLGIFQIPEIDKFRFQSLKEVSKDDNQRNDALSHQILDPLLADVILIDKAEKEELMATIQMLKNELNEKNEKLDQIENKNSMMLQETLAEAEKKRMETIRQMEQRIKIINDERNKEQLEYLNNMKSKEEEYKKSIEEMEHSYSKKLAFESKKYYKLESEKVNQKLSYENEIQKLKEMFKEEKQSMNDKFQMDLEALKKQSEATQKQFDHLKLIFDEKLNQEELDHDEEMKKYEEDTGCEIRKLKLDNLKLKEFNEMKDSELKKKDENEAKVADEFKALKSKLKENEIILNEKDSLNEKLISEKTELVNEIKTKEGKIHKQKVKIKDLQKLKHSLTNSMKELKEQIMPKNKEIENLQDKIVNLEEEFNIHLSRMKEQVEELANEKTKIDILHKQVESEEQKKQEFKRLFNEIVSSIYKCIQTKTPKEYGREMIKLYQAYCQDELPENLKKNTNAIAEFERQLQFVESALESQYKSYIHDKAVNIKKQKNMTNENMELIKELNALRVENKELLKDLNRSEAELKRVKEQVNKETSSPILIHSKEKKQSPDALPDLEPRSKKPGKLMRGSMSVSTLKNGQENERLKTLLFQLQENADIILYQKLEIKRLKEQILILLEEKHNKTEEKFKSPNTQRNDSIENKNQNEDNINKTFLPSIITPKK